MKKIIYPERKDWYELLQRPTATFSHIQPLVQEIFEEIQKEGDTAIKKYSLKFDNVDLSNFEVSTKEITDAKNALSKELKEAIKVAKTNIETFHSSQKREIKKIETSPGVICWQEKRAIEKVGLYIPGGTAPLFSTILMLALPATIAGCDEIILCTPPNDQGFVHPAILYTAALCGVTKIFKIGGIQAIGALTFGTETVLKVDKIFGPGNQFVTVAKQISTQYGISIDMPAGPSELLVLADHTANPVYVAADLLSQAEHGTDSQVILVSKDKDFALKVEIEVNNQIQKLPRKNIAEKAIENSKIIIVQNNQEAIDLINLYAPEHFIICTEDNDFFVSTIKNAGSVFIGNYTPESAGDYASGTNHTLPTNGFAKAYSGVNLDSFMKSITFQEISKTGLKGIGSAIEIMAATEGLDAHKNAVTVRLKDLK
ncbi:histidinol dehydrogenase [Namhaeicola litoreus]|uniref:Histidinol dehydrogenase n=1 Tax=Namhaeicola litoreus TaxID=1052145 RepID=A0ABW3Y319_9FLAO